MHHRRYIKSGLGKGKKNAGNPVELCDN